MNPQKVNRAFNPEYTEGQRRDYKPLDPATLPPLEDLPAGDLVALYIRDALAHNIMPPHEEVALAQRKSAGQDAEAALDTAPPDLRPQLLATIEDGKEAGQRLVELNTRLVYSLCKRYRESAEAAGLPFLDLLQEGNIGLLHAVRKFEWQKGNRFSTYATWWIRQAIVRAMAEKGSVIRVPVHQHETWAKVRRVMRELRTEHPSNEPTLQEVADRAGMPVRKVVAVIEYMVPVGSLDVVVNGTEDGNTFAELVGIDSTLQRDAERSALSDTTAEALTCLNPREARIITMRYGLNGGNPMTLTEVGAKFGVSRERIRQLEMGALKKLRHPSRARRLRPFWEKGM